MGAFERARRRLARTARYRVRRNGRVIDYFDIEQDAECCYLDLLDDAEENPRCRYAIVDQSIRAPEGRKTWRVTHATEIVGGLVIR